MYDYREAMKEDIKEYLKDNYSSEELKELLEDHEAFKETLNDDLWVTDSVTGNASGSYTFNRWKAQEYVTANIELLHDAVQEFCEDAVTIGEKFLDEEWEWFDVTIRCYLLNSIISEVLDEMEV
jgi:hypothetical protein